MRTAPVLSSWLFAAMLALLLAVRLLSPAGFMPAFDNGQVTIVACPDAGGAAPTAAVTHHHHGDGKAAHQQCPYAAGSAPDALGSDFAPLVALLVFAAALLLGRTFVFIERNGALKRPPSRAPPISA
jgi:hypothetical protein